ncbi:MAG: DMT family transporter [Lutisporaceae bacterium]|jgi:drug/metabolite transporter (DMT)-like permease
MENKKGLWCNPWIVVLLGVVGISLSSIFAKYSTAPSIVLASYRMFFSIILLVPALIKNHRHEIKRLRLSSILLCSLSGVFLALHFIFFFESIKYASIASLTVLVNMEVIIVAIIMWLFWKEKISRLGAAGIVLALLGSIIIAFADTSKANNMIYGDFLAVMAALFSSGYTIIGRLQRSNASANVSTTMYTSIVYLGSFLTIGLIMVFTGTPMLGYGINNIVIGLALSVFCTMLGHSLLSWGLKYIKASYVSVAKLGEPVIATILAIILFGQVPGIQQVIGGVVIIGGIYLCIFS